jgi:hypothetical protein
MACPCTFPAAVDRVVSPASPVFFAVVVADAAPPPLVGLVVLRLLLFLSRVRSPILVLVLLVPTRKLSPKNFDVSFSSTFFVLSHFRVFFSDGSSKTLQKTFCKKNRVEKFLQKFRPKVQNRLFLDFFLITFLGVSRCGELKKHDKRYIESINLTLVPFWPLTHPPTTGVTDFFLIGGPVHRGWIGVGTTI